MHEPLAALHPGHTAISEDEGVRIPILVSACWPFQVDWSAFKASNVY